MTRGGLYHHETMRTARLLIGCAVLLLLGCVGLLPRVLSSGGWQGLGTAAGLVAVTVGVCMLAANRAADAGVLFDYELRRKFRGICRQRGLAKPDEAGRLVFPRLSQFMGSPTAWAATVRPLLGQSVADWERSAEGFALAFAVPSVRFVDNGDGTISMKAGYRPLESRKLVVNRGDEVPDVAVGDLRGRLASVPIGVTESGHSYRLPLLDSHCVVAGTTGAGKGSVIWSVLLGLDDYRRAGVVRFWGFDPKRVELALGRQLFGDRYACDAEDMVALLERAEEEMQERATGMAGKVRRFEPSPEQPVNVLVIDELGYLSSLLSDRKLQQRAERALNSILVLGRAVGFVCLGALQDPRKSTLENRDLWPVRVAMRLPAGMVDLVLGPGMRDAGALCDLIPAGPDGAGVAFVLDEGSTLPRCIRVTWCSDDLIRTVAGSLSVPAPMPQLAAD